MTASNKPKNSLRSRWCISLLNPSLFASPNALLHFNKLLQASRTKKGPWENIQPTGKKVFIGEQEWASKSQEWPISLSNSQRRCLQGRCQKVPLTYGMHIHRNARRVVAFFMMTIMSHSGLDRFLFYSPPPYYSCTIIFKRDKELSVEY